MDKTGSNIPLSSQSTFSYRVDNGSTILCMNGRGNRLLVAGRANFQLFLIETDRAEEFNEVSEFQIGTRARLTLQPTDISWNPIEENCAASVSATGYVTIWDIHQLTAVNQFKIHTAMINRLQFHPSNSKLLLTASQDGFAKLIDFRGANTNKVVASFRHSSEDGFRDIHINASNPDIFASALNDQPIVPIWDMRRMDSPISILAAAQKTHCLAWSPLDRNWLATGGRDRTIRIWNIGDQSGIQKPIFKVQSFGTVTKLGWRPTCRHEIASLSNSNDRRIHVWDVRRGYLPAATFYHHRDTVCDFLWRPESDNLISVGRDERLVHTHISSAFKTNEAVSIFSLNVTPTGHAIASTPDVDSAHVRTLYAGGHLPRNMISLKRIYSEHVLSHFKEWNETIIGRSKFDIFKNIPADNSVELFHQFANRWTFGDGDKSSEAVAKICDINSAAAEELKRPDLKATWQVMKMIYADYDTLQNYRNRSSRHTTSANKFHHTSDSMSGHRYHHHHHHHHHYHHHHHHHAGGLTKANHNEQQCKKSEFQPVDDPIARKHAKSQETTMNEVIDGTDAYIVRDILTDDIIFLTPEDILNSNTNSTSNNGYEAVFDNELDIDLLRDGIIINNHMIPSTLNSNNDVNEVPFDTLIHGDDPDGEMETSTQSVIPAGSDKFFTIDESYCPTAQNHPLDFDPIIQQTILYYIENNELQVAVHLLLALSPKLGDKKMIELFSGAHFDWIRMYIDLLKKLRLFVKANQVIKHCIEKGQQFLNYDHADYDGSLILSANSTSVKPFPTPGPIVTNNNTAPQKHFVCSICRMPCRGTFMFCGICFHGGHTDHMRMWFQRHDECPSACGHHCKLEPNRNRRSRNLNQRAMLKASFALY